MMLERERERTGRLVSLPGGFAFQWLDFSRETELFEGTLTIPLITLQQFPSLCWSDNNVGSQLRTSLSQAYYTKLTIHI